MPETEISRTFGDGFLARLQEFPIGEWSGPARSDFGLHLVIIDARGGGRVPEFDDVREAVREHYLASQSELAVDRLYESLAERYDVIIDEKNKAPDSGT